MVNHVRRGLVVNHLYLESKGLTFKLIPELNILDLNFPTNIPLLIGANWQFSPAQYTNQYKNAQNFERKRAQEWSDK